MSNSTHAALGLLRKVPEKYRLALLIAFSAAAGVYLALKGEVDMETLLIAVGGYLTVQSAANVGSPSGDDE